MRTIEMTAESGSDRMLRLTVPVEQAERRYRVVVVFEPETASGPPARSEWPPGFIESTAGSWVGEFERCDEGAFEQREEL
ncbi:MAG: hypothetical protein ACREJB_10855 [Planctomycetaceae bacterium]